ncbi:YigZ family protein [Alloscardovia venturai]|uniref:YigZ family protein n=1 Tax=Alloscardovia venturai TaxID=1769421 RepID=A0ABW2Y8A4_9BIFI
MQTVTNKYTQPAHFSFVEKKSEFIADACHIENLDEAVVFVESIRAEHPKARHVCFAAIVGASEAQFQERMSDDGEPSGTAGKPVLQVLRRSGTTDTAIAVTRYFGGVLLGAGGLVRAYSTAASGALKAAEMSRVVPAQGMVCDLDYSQYATLQHLIKQYRGVIHAENFTDKVSVEFLVPISEVDRVEQAIRRVFQDTVKLVRGELESMME